MRVSAIGLVKEAFLDGLSNPSPENVFASKHALGLLSPILFQPDPKDLFITEIKDGELEEYSEPARLLESLMLYYILLQRDTQNKVHSDSLVSFYLSLNNLLDWSQRFRCEH